MDDDEGRRSDLTTSAARAWPRDGGTGTAATSGEMARRRFLIGAGVLGAAAAVRPEWLLAATVAMPNAEGFLLVDMKKCQGCGTCMMMCSLAHSGEASYALSRIQIQQDSFAELARRHPHRPVPPVPRRAVRRSLPGDSRSRRTSRTRSSATCG